MLRIAICDDQLMICQQLGHILVQLAEEDRKSMKLEYCTDGQALINDLYRGITYDLIFLDIEMPQLDGIALGQAIRHQLGLKQTLIVYISAKESYAMDLFKLHPLDFLVKPLTPDKLRPVWQEALAMHQQGGQMFGYYINRVYDQIALGQVVYFASQGRQTQMVTTGGERIAFYGQLSHIQQQVGSYPLMVIHKSYLINYYHIKSVAATTVTMANGETLPISKKYRASFKQAFLAKESGERS